MTDQNKQREKLTHNWDKFVRNGLDRRRIFAWSIKTTTSKFFQNV